ncbi:MAG TPA: zinc ribbon domain-containing protein [Thermoanaerobaculia bacterium]|nr:zinc ribbon domain-containing protein [Thermoanaerobaculia bacterium]
MTKAECVACHRSIDTTARLCPYCGANPRTGEKVDTDALLQEVFRPRELTTSESVLEYARQRQGVVVTASVIVAFLILAGLHSFVTSRNANAVTDSPAVPLTEITDLSNRVDETKPQPMPELKFQYEGRPQMMHTYIVEPGAVAPAPAPPAPAPAQKPK